MVSSLGVLYTSYFLAFLFLVHQHFTQWAGIVSIYFYVMHPSCIGMYVCHVCGSTEPCHVKNTHPHDTSTIPADLGASRHISRGGR